MKIKKHKEKSRLIIYHGNELLVLQKCKNKLEYGLVGGYLEPGESPETAVIREAFEEVAVQLSEQELEYQCSVTINLKNKQKLSKHYFLCSDSSKPFSLAEPHKFRKLEWVPWKDTVQFLGKSDRKVVKSLFKPCKLNY